MLASATIKHVTIEPSFDWCQSDEHRGTSSHDNRPTEGLIVDGAFVCFECLDRVIERFAPLPPRRR